MLNQVIIVGRITKISDGAMILAVPRSFKNEEGVYDTDFIKVKMYNSISQNAVEYCKVGDLVGVRGRLQSNGQNNILSVVADKLTFLSSKKED